MTAPGINRVLADERNDRSSRYGAPMGARNYLDNPEQRLYAQRVNFVDGDYAPDGTYWGSGGEPLWCAFSLVEGSEHLLSNEVYVRARDRVGALKAVRAEFPVARFLRNA